MAHLIVAGALTRGDRVLLGHRIAGRRYFPDCWDLPGGHVESGERAEDALVRELREEIGVEAVVPASPSLHIEHRPDSDEGAVLDVWTVTSWRGEPINLAHDEHDELRWVTAHDLATLDLAHAAYLEFLPGLLTTTR